MDGICPLWFAQHHKPNKLIFGCASRCMQLIDRWKICAKFCDVKFPTSGPHAETFELDKYIGFHFKFTLEITTVDT